MVVVAATAHHLLKAAMVALPSKDIRLSKTTALHPHSSTEDIRAHSHHTTITDSLLLHRSNMDTTRDHHHHSSTETMDLRLRNSSNSLHRNLRDQA